MKRLPQGKTAIQNIFSSGLFLQFKTSFSGKHRKQALHSPLAGRQACAGRADGPRFLSCKRRSPRRDGRGYIGRGKRNFHTQPFPVELLYRVERIYSIAVVHRANVDRLGHHHLCRQFHGPRHALAFKPYHIEVGQRAFMAARIMVMGIPGGCRKFGMVRAAAA